MAHGARAQRLLLLGAVLLPLCLSAAAAALDRGVKGIGSGGGSSAGAVVVSTATAAATAEREADADLTPLTPLCTFTARLAPGCICAAVLRERGATAAARDRGGVLYSPTPEGLNALFCPRELHRFSKSDEEEDQSKEGGGGGGGGGGVGGGGGGGSGGRGLHSSTFQLIWSALYGSRVARRGCAARAKRVFRVCRVFSCVRHGSS